MPTVVSFLQRIPWPITAQLAVRPTTWRLLSGASRRLGWNASALGWYTVRSGPFAGVRLQATHVNHLWVPLGVYEVGVVACLAALVARSNGGEVWDIGANRGLTALAAANAGASRVLAFEPLERNLRELNEHLASNPRLAPRISPQRLAISDADGEVPLTLDPEDGSVAQLAAEGVRAYTGDTRQTTMVEARSIDSLVTSLGRAPAWPGQDVEIAQHGNCLAAVAAMLGLAHEELTPAEMEVNDPRYPVLVTVRCKKRPV